MSSVLENAAQAATLHGRHAFNVAVWDRLAADPELAKIAWRIETDEHGQIIISPPPAPSHGNLQSEIARLLGNWNPGGKVITECPISTSKGVKAADVAWCSAEIWSSARDASCFAVAPEICVEVLSPSNSHSEIDEKKSLYFEGGSLEVWLVAPDGNIRFFHRDRPQSPLSSSSICKAFPPSISRSL